MWIVGALQIGAIVLAVALSCLTAWLLYRFAFGRRRWSILPGIAIALGLSCLPAAMDALSIRSDLAGFAEDEIRPANLTLQTGALLHLQDGNHAGLTCGPDECPFDALPFVTGTHEADLDYATSEQGGPVAAPLDLWRVLEGADRTQPFPYRYAYISAPVYWYAIGIGARDYRKPEWPENGKGVHMLVEVPEDGMLDLTDDRRVHFRRFNIQEHVDSYFFWGMLADTVQTPQVDVIFQDLAAIARPEGR